MPQVLKLLLEFNPRHFNGKTAQTLLYLPATAEVLSARAKDMLLLCYLELGRFWLGQGTLDRWMSHWYYCDIHQCNILGSRGYSSTITLRVGVDINGGMGNFNVGVCVTILSKSPPTTSGEALKFCLTKQLQCKLQLWLGEPAAEHDQRLQP